MPKGPQGQKRPADVIGNAVRVMRIATGDETEPIVDEGKNKAAVELGRRGGLKGGKARAAALPGDKRKAIAKAASAKRWNKREN